MNAMGFKVAGLLRHKGATSSPPAATVVKHPKTAWQPSGHCSSHVLLGTDTPNNRCLLYKKVFKGEFRMQYQTKKWALNMKHANFDHASPPCGALKGLGAKAGKVLTASWCCS